MFGMAVFRSYFSSEIEETDVADSHGSLLDGEFGKINSEINATNTRNNEYYKSAIS